MNKWKVASIFALTLVVGLGGIFWFKNRDETSAVKGVGSLKTLTSRMGLVVKTEPDLVQKTTKNAGQLWAFTQPKTSKQEFLIDANYEQGESLKKLTGYTKQSLRA